MYNSYEVNCNADHKAKEKLESPSIRRLRTLIDSCSEYEAMKLVPVAESLLTVLHTGTPEEIK